jgi:hypothetical protein
MPWIVGLPKSAMPNRARAPNTANAGAAGSPTLSPGEGCQGRHQDGHACRAPRAATPRRSRGLGLHAGARQLPAARSPAVVAGLPGPVLPVDADPRGGFVVVHGRLGRQRFVGDRPAAAHRPAVAAAASRASARSNAQRARRNSLTAVAVARAHAGRRRRPHHPRRHPGRPGCLALLLGGALQELVEGDPQVPHTDAGGVVDDVGEQPDRVLVLVPARPGVTATRRRAGSA